MATLPDLDTDNISFIAYYNILANSDTGYEDWAPDEITSYGSLNSYDAYDNGLDGSVLLPSQGNGANRNASFRVKEDGWMMVWLDNTLQEATNTNSSQRGPWDIVSDMGVADNTGDRPNANPDRLLTTIQNFYNQTSISDDINESFNTEDVQYYNYLHTGTNATVLGLGWHDHGGTSSGDSTSANFSYTEGTNLIWSAAYACHYSEFGGDGHIYIGGNNASQTNLVGTGGEYIDGYRFGSRVHQNVGYAGSASTSYDVGITSGRNNEWQTLTNVFVWS